MPKYEFRVNGRAVSVDSWDPGQPLLYILRNTLGLRAAKFGCGLAQCGACTVLLDGKPVRSCITPAASAAGKQITTIEGIHHPLQDAFLEAGAMQCGYCTPGMIVSAAGLLKETPHPTREQIVRHMNGNLCRCGAYLRIIAAIRKAAESHA
jgi:aerobic-type carbon monoxide dehydrogenase small subunit (CoxS/CutS family)